MTRHHSLGDLFALSRIRVVALIYSFFDASFTNHRAGVTTVAGYVAPLDAWKEVETEWDAMLSHWRLDDFHLTDLVPHMGRSNGTLCALSFAQIIFKSRLHGIGAALNDLDWTANRGPKDLDHYYACLGMLLNLLGEHMGCEFPNDDVAVVVDRDMGDQEMAAGVFAWLQKRRPQLATFAIGDRKKFRAIECADLAAGHLRRKWLENEFGKESGLPDYLVAMGRRGRYVVRSEKQAEIIRLANEAREAAKSAVENG